MITNANNTGFETNLGDWANFGNHSAVRSTVDDRTGSASMKITSSGAGDTTANFMYLPPSALGTIVSGNKYTIELWARSATATSTITINIGTQSATSGTLSTTFASFTKVVFNFTATSGSDTLKIYANKAIDSLYVDDVSLTQAYDAMVLAQIKTSTDYSGGSKGVFGANVSDGGSTGYEILVGVDNTFRIVYRDGTTTASSLGQQTINDGKYRICIATLARDGVITRYVDGVAQLTTTSISAIGKVSGIGFLGAGKAAGTFFTGNIGFTQIVRFASLPSGVASTIAQISQQKKPLSAYENGTIVAWYDWESGGYDKSGFGNHLTKVADPQIIKIQK